MKFQDSIPQDTLLSVLPEIAVKLDNLTRHLSKSLWFPFDGRYSKNKYWLVKVNLYFQIIFF